MLDIRVPDAARALPRNFEGTVFISDIDKTYLATHIDSIGGLLRAAFEAAEKKANIPGFSIILRAVRRGAGGEAAGNPVFFVSASPPQMARKLHDKMELDGVDHDGIIFKNQMRYVRTAEFRKLREQIGYKLGALLSLWFALPPKTKLVLFGDDSESDAMVYSLFAEILAKTIRPLDLFHLLEHMRVYREEALNVAWLARRVREPAAPVQAAFINLETGSQAGWYSRFGGLVYATDNSLQTACALYEQGYIREQAVRSIARDMALNHEQTPSMLARSLDEGARRGTYGIDTLDKLWPSLHKAGLLPPPPVRGEAGEGAVTRLNPRRWKPEARPLRQLKRLYSDEDRY